MKFKVLVVAATTAIALTAASSADAAWFMRYGQAKAESKRYSKESCESSRECTAWGVGKCVRRSESSFSCLIANWFYPPNTGEEDIECKQVLHWGVRHGGIIVLKNAGEAHCR